MGVHFCMKRKVNRVGIGLLYGIFSLLCAAGPLAASPYELFAAVPWEVRQPAPGVVYRHFHFSNLFDSPQNICLADVDVQTTGVQLRFLMPSEGTREPVSQMAQDCPRAAVVINGNFFDLVRGVINYQSKGSRQFVRIAGRVMATTQDEMEDPAAIAIDLSGKPLLLTKPEAGWESLPYPGIMATKPPLIVGGETYERPPKAGVSYKERHPRTAIGLTKDHHLILLIVDGRTATAAGMTMAELRETMQALGCVDAINMDGGGSTTIWARGSGVLNHPSDGNERPVANAIAVIARR